MRYSDIMYYCWALILLVGLAIIVLFSNGCAKERIVYRDVNIPVKCDAEMPQRPVYTDNITEMGIRFIEYIKQLEASLKYCKGD